MADDVALNRELVAGYFEGTALKLITATNGLEALAQAEKHRPDVILMDMRMPESGWPRDDQTIEGESGAERYPCHRGHSIIISRRRSAGSEDLRWIHPQTV